METKHLERLKNQTPENLCSLKEAVLWALELFWTQRLQNIKLKDFKKRVVIGSWNAIVTWEILFAKDDTIIANESTFMDAIKKSWVDGVTILSASGSKHATIMAKEIQKNTNLEIELLTCNSDCTAKEIIWEKNMIVTPRNPEPYTYNTSTYMWWLLAESWENPEEIYNYLLDYIEPKLKNFDFSKYNWYVFSLPTKFYYHKKLIDTKFVELFGRNIARDIRTDEELMHAITVVPSKTELLIRFTDKEVYFENDILDIDLPKHFWNAAMMAIWYYIVWFIQDQHEAYFMKNIWKYIENLQKSSFWKNMSVIV